MGHVRGAEWDTRWKILRKIRSSPSRGTTLVLAHSDKEDATRTWKRSLH